MNLFFIYLFCVPALGILAQWLAWRFRFPSILLLLGFGIALGVYLSPADIIEGLLNGEQHHEVVSENAQSGTPAYSEQEIEDLANKFLLPFVSLSVAVILFEGGLTLRWSEMREGGKATVQLVTIGAIVTWGLTALCTYYLAGLDDWRIAALVGAFLVVTGPTVVVPLLRHIRPSKKMGSIVKWEGIVIDPVGAILAVLVYEYIHVTSESDGGGVATVLWHMVSTGVVGLGVGVISGYLLVQLIKRFWIPDYLQAVSFLAVTLLAFGVSNLMFHESGLLTVTVLGIYLVNQKQVAIHHVREFKEHLGVFLISCLFIVLGSNFKLESIQVVGVNGLWFLLAMIFVVRPISVFAATIKTGLSMQEKVFLSFLAPRGIVAAAVASVFSLELANINVDQNLRSQIVPLTFVLIVGTVTVYGLFSAPLARLLKLADENPQGVLFAGAGAWVRDIAEALMNLDQQVLLVDSSYANWRETRMRGIPVECASILSEHLLEETDLSGIGRLVAATPSNEVNALAVQEYTSVFESKNVFQMAPWDINAGKRTSVSEHSLGRLVASEDLPYVRIRNGYRQGAEVKTTLITDEYTIEDFYEKYGVDNAAVLFVLDSNGRLHINSAHEPHDVKTGDTVIAIVGLPVPDGHISKPSTSH